MLYRRGISRGKNIAVTMYRNRICMQPMRHLAYTQESSSFFPIWGVGGARMGFKFFCLHIMFPGSERVLQDVPKFPMCCPRVFP